MTAIDKTNKAYDVLTIKAAFGENIAKDAVLFEATAVAGTSKKNTSNFVLFDAKKVEDDGPVLCTPLDAGLRSEGIQTSDAYSRTG